VCRLPPYARDRPRAPHRFTMNIPKIHHTSYLRYTYTVRLLDNHQPENTSPNLLKIWYNRYIEYFFILRLRLTQQARLYKRIMKPKDYTKLAIDTYSKAKWECYGFKGGHKNPTRTIDNYLHIGWGILFQRKLSDSEVQLLKLWIRRRKKAEEYRANDKDTISHRIRTQSEYIDSDGYISMRKIIPTPPNHHPKETKRIQDLLDELKIIKEMWK
jgi:hypothetical protein